MARPEIQVLGGSRARSSEEGVERVVALGRALSDPIRVRMLGMLAAEAESGRGCCDLPELGAPVGSEEDSPGICVCEFEECFYSLDREAAGGLLAGVAGYLDGAGRDDG